MSSIYEPYITKIATVNFGFVAMYFMNIQTKQLNYIIYRKTVKNYENYVARILF